MSSVRLPFENAFASSSLTNASIRPRRARSSFGGSSERRRVPDPDPSSSWTGVGIPSPRSQSQCAAMASSSSAMASVSGAGTPTGYRCSLARQGRHTKSRRTSQDGSFARTRDQLVSRREDGQGPPRTRPEGIRAEGKANDASRSRLVDGGHSYGFDGDRVRADG